MIALSSASTDDFPTQTGLKSTTLGVHFTGQQMMLCSYISAKTFFGHESISEIITEIGRSLKQTTNLIIMESGCNIVGPGIVQCGCAGT